MDPERVRAYLQVACAGLGFDIGEVWWTQNENGTSTVARIGKIRLIEKEKCCVSTSLVVKSPFSYVSTLYAFLPQRNETRGLQNLDLFNCILRNLMPTEGLSSYGRKTKKMRPKPKPTTITPTMDRDSHLTRQQSLLEGENTKSMCFHLC